MSNSQFVEYNPIQFEGVALHNPRPKTGGGGGVTSITFDTGVSNALASSDATLNITIPSSVAAGDLLIWMATAWDTGGANPTNWPSDWTEVISTGGTANFDRRQAFAYKIADTGDAGSAIAHPIPVVGTTFFTNGRTQHLLAYSGDVSITSVTAQNAQDSRSNGNPSAITVTSGSGTAPMVVYATWAASGNVSPRSFTPAKDYEQQQQILYMDTWVGHKIYDSSPADVTVDMNDEGNDNIVQACYLEVS